MIGINTIKICMRSNGRGTYSASSNVFTSLGMQTSTPFTLESVINVTKLSADRKMFVSKLLTRPAYVNEYSPIHDDVRLHEFILKCSLSSPSLGPEVKEIYRVRKILT